MLSDLRVILRRRFKYTFRHLQSLLETLLEVAGIVKGNELVAGHRSSGDFGTLENRGDNWLSLHEPEFAARFGTQLG